MGWPYVVGVLWGPVVQSPWSPEWGTTVISLCVSCGPSCCNLVLITTAAFVHGINPQLADCEVQIWPWHASCYVVADYTKQNSPQWGLTPAKISLWICCFWSLVDYALMLSEVGHWVCWFCASWEGLWCSPIWHYLWLALGNLFGAISNTQLVTVSTGPGYGQ